MLPARIIQQSKEILSSYLNDGKSVQVSTITSSMKPAIFPGDTLTVTRAQPDSLRSGDIILVDIDNQWTAHRVVALRSYGNTICAITRGDNSTHSDTPVPINKIIGKVIRINRKTGNTTSTLTAPPVKMDEALLMASFPSCENRHPQHITAEFEPDSFFQSAQIEGLAPLIYFHRYANQHDTPDNPLRNSYMTTLSRNTIFLDKLHAIATELQQIDFILLKGACLASHVYPSPGLRQFSDIDIFIKPDDVPAANLKLNQSGYRRFTGPEADVIPTTSSYLNSILYRSDNPCMPSIHVHWHLINSIMPKYLFTNIDMSEIWRSAIHVNDTWLTLDPRHLLIHLCEHATRHSFDRLILLRDIAEVILFYEIDWDQFVHDCIEFGLTHPVYYCLLYVSRKTGITPPLYVLNKLRPAHPGMFEKLFFSLAVNNARSPELCNLLYFDSAGSFQNKIRLMNRMLFPPLATLSCASGSAMNRTTYMSRLLRGARHITVATRHIINNTKQRSLQHHEKI